MTCNGSEMNPQLLFYNITFELEKEVNTMKAQFFHKYKWVFKLTGPLTNSLLIWGYIDKSKDTLFLFAFGIDHFARLLAF